MKHTFLLLISLGMTTAQASESSMQRQGAELSARLQKSCDRPIMVDLMDFAYGLDELRAYEYPGLEYCQRITGLMADACQAHSANAKKLANVKTVYCQRGSIEGPRLILRKNGDLVLLAVNGREDWESWMKQELAAKLKLDFDADEKKELALAAEQKKEAEGNAREAEQKANQETQQKKIEALTAWFQAEVQKLTAKPTPEMAQKIDDLTKEYQEKLDALTR